METRSIKGKSQEEINAALLDTMRDLSGKLELTHLLASVLERAVTLLDLTGGELAIYHEEHKYLEVVASHNLGMNSIGVHLNHGEGAMGRVSETLKPLIITDYQTWEGRSDQYTKTTIQSVIVVPLLIGTQLVGVLGVYLEEHRQFDDDDLKLLNMFAPLAATAIENARLFKEERRRADEQKALLETMTDLSGKLELNHLLTSVLERAVFLLKVTGGELAIYHEESKELEVVASHNLGVNSKGVRLKHGEGAMGQVAETLKPVIIANYQTWEGRSDKYAKTTVRSVIMVPLLIGNQLVGALGGVHLQENRHFDNKDLQLLNMFAPLAATAIENARLFKEERRRADEQKALLETMTDLSGKLELNHLLTSVLERAVFLLKVTGGELAIYHEESKELEVVASHNLGVNSKGVRLKHGEGAMGQVADTLGPVIITDYQTWEGRSDKYAKTTVRSVIMVPLLIGNQLVGALGGVHLEENRHFDNKDLQLLNMFAPLAATAIENARLFDKTTRLLEEAEHRAEELRRTQDHLIRQEKLASLGELTAGIAHEIQNPLNFVNNFSEVSNELIDEMKSHLATGNWQPATQIADDVKQNMEKILHHGKRADAIVKGMLQHSRTSSGQKELTDINALCDEYLRLAYHGLRAKDKSFNAAFTTDFDATLGKVNLIPQEIGRVILNLINNAFYAVSEKKKLNLNNYEPTVTVTTKKTEKNVEIHVTDNGIGIPQKVIDKIFQPFFTTKPTGQGTGLGLSLSYDIITKGHGGELKVVTKEGEGSEFIVQLPIV